MRECGGCTACCTLLAVPELKKPAGKGCTHQGLVGFAAKLRSDPLGEINPREDFGCTIYSRRPQSCRDFRCVWLDGAMPEELRPDRTGVVVSLNATPRHGDVLVLHVPLDQPDAWRKGPLGAWVAEAAERVPVMIARAGLRGNPPRYATDLYALGRAVKS